MPELSFIVFLTIGMVAMFFVMWAGGHAYGFKVWKIVIADVFLTIIGAVGVYLMGFVEKGEWVGARSFYGAHFLVPILMFPVAKLLRMPYGKVLDMSAPAGCLMLALLKVKCVIDGCCGGRMLTLFGKTFRFPSQIVECIAAVVLMVVLLIMIYRRKWTSMIYPWYMILYGAVRFCLNCLRDTTPWFWIIPSGHLWSIISIIIGVIALILIKRKLESKA